MDHMPLEAILFCVPYVRVGVRVHDQIGFDITHRVQQIQ